MESKAREFEQHRGYLGALAYRMVGTRADAEDLVQEAWFRWDAVATAELRNPRAWLTTTLTRLCIDHLRSRRSRREDYVGPWLPEALVDEAGPGDAPEDLGADLSYALLVLLERLSPAERAAYLLREVFDHDYADLARILQREPAACRQLVHRAKARIHGGRPRFDVDRAALEQVMDQFVEALSGADAAALVSVLAHNATLVSDGGGKASAVSKPVHGADTVARLLLGFRAAAPDGFRLQRCTIGGEPGLIGAVGATALFTLSLGVVDGQIEALYFVRNPDKLAHALTAGP